MMESKTTVSIVALVLCFSLVVKCQRDVCKTLTVSNGGHEGKWHNPQFCPPRYYATGFALKIQKWQGWGPDDTGLNAVELYCHSLKYGGVGPPFFVESGEGKWGKWEDPHRCKAGTYIKRFKMKVEGHKKAGDDGSAYYVDAQCQDFDSKYNPEYISGGHQPRFGAWGKWSGMCPPKSAVCGIQSRIQPYQGWQAWKDDTALNDVKLYCCWKDKVPLNPPALTCAHIIGNTALVAGEGQTTASVEWTSATARDPDNEETKITLTHSPNYTSGQQFSEGTYTILFMAKNDDGDISTCVLGFSVKVVYCDYPGQPENGLMNCGRNNYGSHCNVTCLKGYEVAPGQQSTITCTQHGSWDRNVPKCEAIPCKTVPVVANGRIDCPASKTTFGSVCSIVCDDGYRRVGSGNGLISCNDAGDWASQNVNCSDATPPEFTSCTDENIVFSIDSVNNTALVTWDIPTGTDNSGDTPTIVEIHNYSPDTRFSAGSYIIHYDITDPAGNNGQPCVFMLVVNTIFCDPPALKGNGSSHMMYNCPDRYRYGAACDLSCRNGYPLIGDKKIQCVKEDEQSSQPKLIWGWNGAMQPFCKEMICSDLPPPKNGALACSLWTLGRQCQIQCEKSFDFTWQAENIYVCSTDTGKWAPTDMIPDCTRRVSPNHAHSMVEFYYYTGACNSSQKNLDQIRHNFIQALSSSLYKAVCNNDPACKAEYVSVTCGPTTRRRRDITNKERRSTHPFVYTVAVDITVPLTVPAGQPLSAALATKANLLIAIGYKMQEEIRSGHFDLGLPDMQIRADDFYQGMVEFKCPNGMVSRMSTSSCAGCPVGMFLSNTTGKCKYCTVGTYQDVENSVDCISCPPDTNTLKTGSTNVSQCIDACDAGSYSSNGLWPCAECPTSSYQPNKGKTSCIKCGDHRRALRPGANSTAQCQDYDILTSSSRPLILLKNSSSLTTVFTLVSWVFLRSNSTKDDLFEITIDNKPLSLTAKNGSIYVNDNRLAFKDHWFSGCSQDVRTTMTIRRRQWIHLAIRVTSSSHDIDVYKDGQLGFHNQGSNVVSAKSASSELSLKIRSDLQLSSFYLFGKNLPSVDILKLSTSCQSNYTGSLFTSDDLSIMSGAKVVLPSMCDDTDDCASNPCGTNRCIDKKGDYECVCTNGYTGRHCTNPPNFCLQNSCQNGATCVNGPNNYTCSCPYGFRGAFCAIKAVNGNWSEWTGWMTCSASCNGGTTTRSRLCNNPSPDPEGKPCNGSANETSVCNTQPCPYCHGLTRPAHGVLSCKGSDDLMTCSYSCENGLFPSTPPLLKYQCGSMTNFKWNHQTPHNPTGQLPRCTYVEPAAQFVAKISGEYLVFPCNQTVIDSLRNNSCSQSSYCSLEIASEKCQNLTRSKRATSKEPHFSVDLTTKVANTDTSEGDLQRFFSSGKVSSGLQSYFDQLDEFTDTTQKVHEEIRNILQISHSNASLEPLATVYDPDVNIVCPRGTVPRGSFCAIVPAGEYIKKGRSLLCPIGHYQEVPGSSHCNKCPNGALTNRAGAESIKECEKDVNEN